MQNICAECNAQYEYNTVPKEPLLPNPVIKLNLLFFIYTLCKYYPLMEKLVITGKDSLLKQFTVLC